MSYKKLIGIMLPTRKRVNLLRECLNSFNAKTKNKSSVEILLKIDDDDQETIDFINSYQSEIEIKTIISDRGNGYGSLNEYYNSLAQISEAEFLMVGNDDGEMMTDNWEEQFIPFSGTNYVIGIKFDKIKDGVKFTNIFSNYNAGPTIPHDYYKEFGTLACHPMIDDWWVMVARKVKEQSGFELERWVDVTVWFKRPDNGITEYGNATDFEADSTFIEGRQHINWNHWYSNELPDYTNKVIEYIKNHPDKF